MSNKTYDIIILGAGESGTGAALLAKHKGFEPFVSDLNEIGEEYKKELEAAGVDYEEGKHSESVILSGCDIVKSPGIPDHVSLIQQAKTKGLKIISEIEYGYRFFEGKAIIAITGSNGKTTTTSLIGHVLKEVGMDVEVGGNIGKSFARIVKEGTSDICVLELSSFQLDGIEAFKPNVAVIMNITPDHLDRYQNEMDLYVESKFRITKNQQEEDYLIYFDDKGVVSNYVQTREDSLNANLIAFKQDEIRAKEFELDEMQLKGPHNQLNAIASILAVQSLELVNNNGPLMEAKPLKNALKSFKEIEHRLQTVAEIDGVIYVNDSKATNTDAAFHALQSFELSIIWIAGGVDKGNDYTDLEDAVENVKALICLGKDNSKLRSYYETSFDHFVEVDTMEQAVEQADALAVGGDVVLLSPACASFDLFQNYEDRGRQFIKEVGQLQSIQQDK